MGGSKSKQTTKIINDTLNQVVTNVLTSTSNVVTNNVSAGQSVGFIIKNSTVTCDPPTASLVSQRMTSDFKMVTQIGEETTSAIKNVLNSAADTTSDTFQKVLSSAGSLSYADSKNKTELSNIVKNIIETNVTTETLNQIINNFSYNQDANITIEDSTFTGPCEVSQDMVVQLQTSAILNKVASLIEDNTQVADIVTKAETTQDITQNGVPEVIDAMGSAVAGALTAAYIPLIICAVLTVCIVSLLGGGVLANANASQPGADTGGDGSGSSSGSENAKNLLGTAVAMSPWGRLAKILSGLACCLLLVGIGVLIWAAVATSKASTRPETVEDNNCQDEYDAFKPLFDEWQSETDPDKKAVLYNTMKPQQDAFSKCMGIAISDDNSESYMRTPRKEYYTYPVKQIRAIQSRDAQRGFFNASK